MVNRAYNPDTKRVLYTEHLRKIPSTCPPPGLCCDVAKEDPLYSSIQALVWIEEADSGGSFIRNCELVNLVRDTQDQPSGARCWRGNLTEAVWLGCLTPPDAEIIFCCDNVNQIPGADDCTTALGPTVEGLVGIRDDNCCCDPICWTGGVALTEGVLYPDAISTCGVLDPANVTMGLYIFGLDTNGKVACKPIPWPNQPCYSEPQEIACMELTDVLMPVEPAVAHAVAGDIEFATTTPVEMEVVFAFARARAFLANLEVVGSPATMRVDSAGATAVASDCSLLAEQIATDCCPQMPSSLSVTLWLQEEPPGGGGANCLRTDSFSISLESGTPPGTYVWSGNANFPSWAGCTIPAVLSVRVACQGLGTSCTNLFTVRLYDNNMGIFDCDCSPTEMSMAISTTYRSVAALGLEVDHSNNCGIIDSSAADMALYIRAGGGTCTRPPNACGV